MDARFKALAKGYIGWFMTSLHYHKSGSCGFKSIEYARMFDRLQDLYWKL